jgi:hypothetical protein
MAMIAMLNMIIVRMIVSIFGKQVLHYSYDNCKASGFYSKLCCAGGCVVILPLPAGPRRDRAENKACQP